MKHLLLFFILFPGSPFSAARAENEPAQAGFLTIVNLITLRTPTFISLGSFELNGGEAVKSGDTSGILAIKPETYQFTLSNEEAKPAKVTGNFTMEQGKTVAIICYDEVKEYRDGSREEKLRYHVLIESDAQPGPRLSLVSLLKEPEVGIEISGAPATLSPGMAHQPKVSLNDNIEISCRGRRLSQFEITKPNHFIGFLFENPETGEVEISLIQNEKLEYQPPLETEEED